MLLSKYIFSPSKCRNVSRLHLITGLVRGELPGECPHNRLLEGLDVETRRCTRTYPEETTHLEIP